MAANLIIYANGIVADASTRHIIARINNDGSGRRWLSRCDERGMISEGDGYRIADVQRWWGSRELGAKVSELLGLH